MAPDQKNTRPLGVAATGYAFMGKAHSNAWRNVASYFDVPAFEQRMLVGGDAEQVARAARRYRWAKWSTDWRGVIARADIDIVDICAPGWLHAEIAITALKATPLPSLNGSSFPNGPSPASRQLVPAAARVGDRSR